MRFANPVFLLFILLVPLLAWYQEGQRRRKRAAVSFSDTGLIKEIAGKGKEKSEKLLRILRFISLFFLLLAFARPQAGQKGEEVLTKGIDIMLVLDTSTSMRAEDFKPHNRLYVAKEVSKEFIKGRKNDRIGIIVFSALSFTQCPLTLDYGAVLDFLEHVEIGMTATDGTAIGTAITTAVNRLKDTGAKTRIIILLTDGRNNMGEIDPITAAKVAQAMGLKIYTIGAGAPGGALYPIDDPIFGKRYVKLSEDLDEGTLSAVAQETGGLYFRATSSEGLRSIFRKIDQMEKTEIKIKEYTNYTELFTWFLWPGIIVFVIEILLRNTYLRKVP